MNIDLIKAKVLDLAIKGQLVEQREDEKLSDEILTLPNIEGPFELPKNWKWIKAEYLIDVISGTSYKKEDITNKTEATSIRIIRGGNIQNGKIYFLDDDIFVKNYLKNHESTIQSKDIVIVASTGSKTVIGKAGLIIDNLIGDHSVQIGAFLRIIRPKHTATSRYLKLFYLTDYYRNIISHSVSGTNINNIKKSHIIDMLIPYPPLQEQTRIIKKVEEIFSILDNLKDHQTSLLSKLDLIRKVAIDKAIKGQLVEQRDDEKLSDEILNLPKIEGSFNIPEHWKWLKLNDVCISIKDGTHNPPPNAKNGIPVLSAKDIYNSNIHTNETNRFVTLEQWEQEKTRVSISIHDILLTIVGSIGRSAIVINEPNFMLQRSVSIIKLKKENITPFFAKIVFDSTYFLNCLHSKSKGTAQKGIYLKELKNIYIPFPPLQEQHRIVQKLEEILSTVRTIENLLKSDKA